MCFGLYLKMASTTLYIDSGHNVTPTNQSFSSHSKLGEPAGQHVTIYMTDLNLYLLTVLWIAQVDIVIFCRFYIKKVELFFLSKFAQESKTEYFHDYLP